MATPGQPTSYKPEYGQLAHNYCLLGATNEVLADFFDVAPRTVDNWIAAHPDFAGAVRRGRAVARVVRACSFSHEVAQTTLYRGKEQTVTNTVSRPPDTQLRALCCFTGPKPHFSVATATENSIDRLECTLWLRLQNEWRKGRKGRKPPATIRRVGFVNDIDRLDGRCGSRFAPVGAAETVRGFAVSPKGCTPGAFPAEYAHRLRKLRKLLSAGAAGPVTALRCGRSSHTRPTWRAPRGPARRTARG